MFAARQGFILPHVFNLASLLLGLLAMGIALIGLVPFLGALNWLALPPALVGLALGVISRGRHGFALCALVLCWASLRLWLGWGII